MAQEELHSRPMRRNAWGTPLPARPAVSCLMGFFFFFFFSRLAPMRLRLGLIRTESGQLRPYRLKPPIQAKIQKIKKVQNTPFELNIKPYFSSLHTNTPNFSSLPLSYSITHLSLSLCSRLSAFVFTLRLPCGYETLSQTATQSLQTPKFSSLSILWVVFNLWTSCFSYYLLLLLNLVYVYIMWKTMLSNILKI